MIVLRVIKQTNKNKYKYILKSHLFSLGFNFLNKIT